MRSVVVDQALSIRSSRSSLKPQASSPKLPTSASGTSSAGERFTNGIMLYVQ